MEEPSAPDPEPADSNVSAPSGAGPYRSRHLAAIGALSAKNRAEQEAKQQEEERKQRNRQALRSRVLRELEQRKDGGAPSPSIGSGGSKRSTSSPATAAIPQGYGKARLGALAASQAPSTSSSSNSTALLVTEEAETAKTNETLVAGDAKGGGNAEQRSRSWNQACNRNVERLANHGIEMVKKRREHQLIKEQRRKLQRAWASHKARQQSLCQCCQDDEVLQHALGKLTKPQPIPPKPAKPESLPSVSEASESSPHTCIGCAFTLDGQTDHFVCLDCLQAVPSKEVFLCVDCHPMRQYLHFEENHPFESVSKLPVKLRRRPTPPRQDMRSKEMSKVDFHQHCTHDDEEGLEVLLENNREWKVEKGVLLCLRLIGDTRKDVKKRNDWVLAMGQKYPDQIVPFSTIIEDDPKAPQMFEECLNAGAKGLKLIGWHSDYIKKHDYSLRHPSLMECYRIAAARKVPIIAHIWIGYSDTKHNYLQDLDVIMAENPTLVFVLAHFGLGFDPQSLPGLDTLASTYPNLYFDTSLYGAHCELWFARASNQAEALGKFIRAYPNQILFGSDVFASRMKRPYEYNDALRGSVGLVELPELACPEFRKTEYFQNNYYDKYGKVDFDPYHLHGLEVDARTELDLLEKIMYGNAARILGLPEPTYRLNMASSS
eukprot:gnl/MRDRNA2_/MRDRNA2_27655_c0_seq1.p1 gnl/MRDRNA2_/MRDRNA2_27655_c0~~gnl/MRDRNA2_/MRDRNA2_27655_c0_seq1.p1  ORF type:complete len:659 (+),score=115.10 gnl/MRDRNA2_/MRDRNA2_27655_c0_seq1:183-2159(+)